MTVTFGLLGHTPRKQEVDGGKRRQASVIVVPGIVVDTARRPDLPADPGYGHRTRRDKEVTPPEIEPPVFSPITLGHHPKPGGAGRLLDLIF